MPKFGKFTLDGRSSWEPGDEGGMVTVYDEAGYVVGYGVSENPFDNKEMERGELFVIAPDLYELAKAVVAAQFSFEIEALQIQAESILSRFKKEGV